MSLCCSFSLQGAASACVILIVQLRGRNNKHKVLIKLAPAEESRPPELLLQAGGFERKANQGSEVRDQSSLTRTCQTMRWLRSALARRGCSFMGGSSPSSASPSSSPEHIRRHRVLLYSYCSHDSDRFYPAHVKELTHPEVDVAFSSAHHQHGLGSFLRCGICCLLTCCLSCTRRRWN